MSDIHIVACPHATCSATLRLRSSLPASTYPCICNYCMVRIAWAQSQEHGRYPYAECLCSKEAEKDAVK